MSCLELDNLVCSLLCPWEILLSSSSNSKISIYILDSPSQLRSLSPRPEEVKQKSPSSEPKGRHSLLLGPQGPSSDLRVACLLVANQSVQVQSATACGCICGGLQPAPASSPPSPPPQKLPPSITTGWAHCRTRRRHDPRNIRTLSSQTYSTSTPTRTQQLLLLSSLTAAFQSCGVHTVAFTAGAVIHRLSTFDLEQLVASAAPRNRLTATRPAHHLRERPTTLPIRGRFFHGF